MELDILKEIGNISVKLTTVKDIKSIKGFYDLWENKAITIGVSGSKVLFLDCFTKSICTISSTSTKDLSKKTVVSNTVTEFIKSYKANVQ